MRAALGAALAGLVVCADVAAARAQDGDSVSVYDKMMGVIGLRNPGTMQDGIDYSERSPLVVPPTRDLPRPVTSTAPPAPNWPRDPDVKRKAAAKASKKVGPHPDTVTELSRPLRPGELNAPGGPGTGGNGSSTANTVMTNTTERGAKKTWFSFDWFNKEEYTTFTGEPARTTLTDPPPGYLTPSPDQPYGVGPDKQKTKIPTVAERVEPTSGSAGGK